MNRGSQFSRQGGIWVPAAFVIGVPSAFSPSKPSTLTRGTTTTVSASRIAFDALELLVKRPNEIDGRVARLHFVAVLLGDDQGGCRAISNDDVRHTTTRIACPGCVVERCSAAARVHGLFERVDQLRVTAERGEAVVVAVGPVRNRRRSTASVLRQCRGGRQYGSGCYCIPNLRYTHFSGFLSNKQKSAHVSRMHGSAHAGRFVTPQIVAAWLLDDPRGA